MKTLKSKKCKACRELFTPFNSMTKACSVKCALVVAKDGERKAWDKKTKDMKRSFRESDTKTRKRAAKESCHRYIRERDKGLSCACCDRDLGEEYDAGHFIESGSGSFLRYHEDNIHGQTIHCNRFRGGDSGDYENKLRQKIGDERVDWLKANKNKLVKRNVDNYREIEDYYNRKYKELKEME